MAQRSRTLPPVNATLGGGDKLAPMIFGRILLGLGVAVATLLQGCASAGFSAAGAAVVLAGGAMAVNPDYAPLPKEVTNKVTLFYPAPQVYATLLLTVERNGRKIVDTQPAAGTIDVSYPFSWTSNNWGGILTITCAARDDATLLLIVGSGRDSSARLRLIGDEIVADVVDALSRQPAKP